MSVNRWLAAAATALGTLAPSVDAAPITFGYVGQITLVDNRFGGVPAGIAVGDTFSISYVFESATPDQFPAFLQFGYYKDALTSVNVTLNGQQFNFTVQNPGRINFSNQILVSDNLVGGRTDMYEISAQSALVPTVLYSVYLQFQEQRLASEPLPTVFTNDALPLALDPLLFTDRRFFSIDFDHNFITDGRVEGNITGLLTNGGGGGSTVPEPNSLALAALTLFGLAIFRRGRKRYPR